MSSFSRQSAQLTDDVIIGAAHIADDDATPTPELFKQAQAFHDENALGSRDRVLECARILALFRRAPRSCLPTRARSGQARRH